MSEPIMAPIKCPGCEHEFEVALTEIKPGNVLKCPNCDRSIPITGDDLSRVQDAWDDLGQT